MKLRATKKEIKNGYNKIVKIGYCQAQTLLSNSEPFAYSTRAEGWACDYYNVDGVCISTGYAPIESKNTTANYDTIKKYELKAQNICNNHNGHWDEKKQLITELLKKFIEEVTK